MRDCEDVPESGHGLKPLKDASQVLAPTLSARDCEVGVETLERSKFRGIAAAAFVRCQALEDPEASLGETGLLDE